MSEFPVNPSEAAFVAYANKTKATVVPLIFKLPNDGLFAWSAFALMEQSGDYAFLLESAETGLGGRYSFMGVSPRRLFSLQDGIFRVSDAAGRVQSESPCIDPLSDLQAQLANVYFPADDSLPPFLGGVVGYTGYDCVHYFEPVGEMKADELGVPDMLWMQTDLLIIFDHFRHELYVVKNCYLEDAGDDWRAAYHSGRAGAAAWLAAVGNAPRPDLHLPAAETPAVESTLPDSTHTEETFSDMVRQAKDYIRCGDIFQVVPSQRFCFSQPAAALDIYRTLRNINPSPYMFYLKCRDFTVVGSSPELMVGVNDRCLSLRPIAGTRPRGRDSAEDELMEDELRADKKEIAEHLMLVDLGRNDLGRVAKIGSVIVPEDRFCRIERYSHVMHMVSDVNAVLADDKTPFDAARAAFPAGTLSGAPKVRAMQIINELENSKRNLYGGFAGYVAYNGDMQTCIVIRTMVIKDGRCYVQAGGGIVADSQPQKEYEESVNKARAALRAAQMAGNINR